MNNYMYDLVLYKCENQYYRDIEATCSHCGSIVPTEKSYFCVLCATFDISGEPVLNYCEQHHHHLSEQKWTLKSSLKGVYGIIKPKKHDDTATLCPIHRYLLTKQDLMLLFKLSQIDNLAYDIIDNGCANRSDETDYVYETSRTRPSSIGVYVSTIN